MPAAHRLGDLCTGHGCWPSRPNTEASPNVYVNGIQWHRKTDDWAPHCCCGIPESHSSVLAEGSPNVFVNNLEAARIGDPVACGSSCMEGSPNVFANDYGMEVYGAP